MLRLPHSTGRPDYPLPPNLLRTSGSSCAASPGDQHRSPTPKLFLTLLPPKLLLLPRNKLSALTLTLPPARQTMLGVPDDETPNSCSLQLNTLSFSNLSTTLSDGYGILSKLKSGKGPRNSDHITPELLRYCANGIACSLACLFNRSFELSQFP